jgi:MFS family permease
MLTVPVLLEGIITFTCGLAVVFVLPSAPSNTRWLNEEERRFAQWRMARDTAGQVDEEGEQSVKAGVKLVFKDWKILVLVLQQLLIVCSSSYGFFFPAIVKSLGFKTTQTLLLTAPPYFVALAISIAVAWSSGRFNERALHIGLPMLVTAIGNILTITLPLSNIGGRYFAMFLMVLGFFCAFNLAYAWVAATIPRPRVKRAAAIAIINGSANIGNLFTSYIFRDKDAPRYVPGGIALTMFCVGICCTALTLKLILKAQNRKMERLDAAGEPYTGSLAPIPKGYKFLT